MPSKKSLSEEDIRSLLCGADGETSVPNGALSESEYERIKNCLLCHGSTPADLASQGKLLELALDAIGADSCWKRGAEHERLSGLLSRRIERKKKRSFKEDFHKIVLEATTSDSLYSAFVNMSRANLPPDVSVRYDALKRRGYIANDEPDIDVYVSRVAHKHAAKFAKIYGKLFETYRGAFTDCVDLVVWGCGCGLDLLALYDNAMQKRNPSFWMAVTSVTLLDISTVSLRRAADMAEVLFPTAIGNIRTFESDFTKAESLSNIQLKTPLAVVPRIHLLSNVLDLFDAPTLERFTEVVKRLTVRESENWNEIFVALSPSYPNVHQRMAEFRQTFGGTSEVNVCDFVPDEETPDRCYCSAFRVQSYTHSLFGWLDETGDNFYKMLRRIALEGPTGIKWDLLFNVFISGKGENAKFKNLASRSFVLLDNLSIAENHQVECLVIIPKSKSNDKLLVIKLGCFKHNTEKKMIAKHVFEKAAIASDERILIELLARIKSGDKESFKEMFKYINVFAWNNNMGQVESDEYDTKHGVVWGSASPIDFTGMYVIKTDGIDTLPKLSNDQKAIAFRRSQYLRIRGAPGTGKTVTMLWRGVYSLPRTHLPVLLLCKTNTLVVHHERLLAATLLSSNTGIDQAQRAMITFDTVDHFLCEQYRIGKGCKLVGKHRSSSEMDDLCNDCRTEAMRDILSSSSAWKSQKQYGAVLIDEAQIIEPAQIKAVYLLTRRSNPYSEFYLFCDEEQSIRSRHDVLETDNDSKKMVVRAPAVGFGKFVTLNEHFRVLNIDLLKIYKFVQNEMEDKYDIKALAMQGILPSVQPLLGVAAPFAICKTENVSYDDLRDWVLPDLRANGGNGETLVLVDDESLARDCSKQISASGSKAEWVSTHLEVRNFTDERQLRRDFYKNRDRVHLTTIDCAQGQTFDNVILILKRLSVDSPGGMEELFTGMTRARKMLRIIDGTETHSSYELLKQFNL
jgi:hypothetical protein